MELQHDLIQARLQLDERLEELLNEGDYDQLLALIELVREDLRLFARLGRRLAAAHDAEVECERHAQAVGCENVSVLADFKNLRRSRGKGWA